MSNNLKICANLCFNIFTLSLNELFIYENALHVYAKELKMFSDELQVVMCEKRHVMAYPNKWKITADAVKICRNVFKQQMFVGEVQLLEDFLPVFAGP